jgi:predicted transcriptional regulator of viral defense system
MHQEYNNQLKTLGSRAAHLITTLYEENKPVFRLEDVQRILNIEELPAGNFVRKLVNRGIVTRLKPGLFVLVPFELGKETEYMGNPLIVARELTKGKDYYLSHGTAMEINGMTTQPQLVVHVTTLEKRRPIQIMGTEFRFIASRRGLFFGLADHWVTKQEKVKVSDLERTVVDGLRMPYYCGGITELAKGIWMRKEAIDGGRLIEYALRINSGAVIRRLGYIMELYRIGSLEMMDKLRNRLTETYVKLDPLLPSEGKFLRKWRLRLNVSADELLTVVRT